MPLWFGSMKKLLAGEPGTRKGCHYARLTHTDVVAGLAPARPPLQQECDGHPTFTLPMSP